MQTLLSFVRSHESLGYVRGCNSKFIKYVWEFKTAYLLELVVIIVVKKFISLTVKLHRIETPTW